MLQDDCALIVDVQSDTFPIQDFNHLVLLLHDNDSCELVYVWQLAGFQSRLTANHDPMSQEKWTVGPGLAQSSGVSVACTVTSVPTILTAAADADYAVPIRTADEEIVNESLMNLLKKLTMRIPSVVCRWSSDRRPFDAVSFGDD
ncbi:hypothetical protein N7541_004362 [Penicillium brevicompactum]|uniref:Uncharacterized protein n=1 Tax=Penicillium brevicompactum TaxID=5074 RepID=A0A9W9UUM3_PENBR|nr:hypothetical protein N7541_004362 [Penicillium brevicompactum]